MPRQSRGRSSAPARPAAPAPTQSRSAHTAAAPAGYASPAHAPAPVNHAPPTAAAAPPAREPGMLAQMAATAGSVAVGSTIGHGISSMLFGGSSHTAPVPEAQAQAPPAPQRQAGLSCDVQAKEFTQCLEKADLPSCTWYLEQLKACQAAAAPY